MTTQAQLEANRQNAQKSTGPKTPEGKLIASQNATTHGLMARRAVIKGEKQAEFDEYKETLMKNLHPEGAVEKMLAERIVTLSWRLTRAERLQTGLMNILQTNQSRNHEKAVDSTPDACSEDLDLGDLLKTDLENANLLPRMIRCESQIETMLNRIMLQLQKCQNTRKREQRRRQKEIEDRIERSHAANEPWGAADNSFRRPCAEPYEAAKKEASILQNEPNSNAGRNRVSQSTQICY